MKDNYIDDFLKAIKEAKTDEEIKALLNQLYTDGFSDGHDEGVSDEREREPEYPEHNEGYE